MKTILFPTDFSDAASRAFIYTLHLARKLEARVITLHVFQRPDISGLMHIPRGLEELYNSIDLYEFENYRDAVPVLDGIQRDKGFTDIEVVHTIHEGKTIDTILARARAEEAGLIVMGTTGARGLKELLLGSVAGEILENASCPVLAVPEQAVFDGRLNRIAFTTSFQEEEFRAIDRLLDLFKPFDPVVDIVNVDLAHTEAHNRRMDQLRQTYATYEKVDFHVLEGTDLQPTLTAFLEQQRTDLVAMVTHKRNFLAELFQYSRTKAMSYHSHIPVLSFPIGVL
ncbi:MAG: universal stress protein [Lewinella sp.]|nr:universal stress protein [Lewinella sp.]